MANRIELCGRIANPPSLRVTPAGTAVLSLMVDCGEKAGELLMPVLMTGEIARAIGQGLKQGLAVRAIGAVRPARLPARLRPSNLSASGIEVIADEITLGGTAGAS